MNRRKTFHQRTAFTLVEILVAMAVFSIFMSGLVATWRTLGVAAMSNTAYARRQGDQMRVLDYLKRDIRRATVVEIYNGATLVTGTGVFGSELRLTIPDFYADSREDDDAIGTKVPNAPTLVMGEISYGSALTVRYYTLGGAAVRDEGGVVRTVGHGAGAFALSFKRETSGAIRSRVFFNQPLQGAASRTLRREVDTVCVPRSELQP